MKNLLLSFFLLVCFSASAQTKLIPADHQFIRYVGRFDHSNPGEVRFDWSGVYIQFNFKGTDCALKMDDTGHNYYNVFVDDQPSRTIDVKSDTTIVIARGLKKKNHKIQMYKRTEGSQGIGSFKGIMISEKGEMLPWNEIPSRKIEFIGNSITCGYGTEGKSASERWSPVTENNYQSYAPIMARAFNADYHIVAHSGMGVVRNYGYKEKVSPSALPARFNRVFDEKELPVWDFKQWKPDMVVINLGTNDFSTKPYPDKEVFKAGYEKLINDVVRQYGELPVFCVVGPMMDEPCYSYVKEMVEELRAGVNTKKVYFVGIPTYLMDGQKDLGSDSHPNYRGQKKMAAHVLPVIASVLNWDYEDQELTK
ncbi:MAG TPA: SGNH/GDSL hydrolase family protein [Prolixibacteraceae bacterium]|nr:SGNH/GDSL hydrolase family protein [Prolixibacteraceae bacterium]